MPHRRLLVPLAVVPLAVGGLLTGTASAAPTAPPVVASAVAAVGPEASLTAATVAIARGQWSKAGLTTHRTAASATRCTAANAGFIATNRTGVVQPVRVGRTVIARVKPGYRLFVCGKSTSPFSRTFVLGRTGDRLPVRFG